MNETTPTIATFGKQWDISNICQFDWYQWFQFQKDQLGRVLEPIKNDGNEMALEILKSNGVVVPQHICCPLTISEQESQSEQKL